MTFEQRAMENVYPMVLSGRTNPPRESGLTMVIDMGSGVAETQDFIDHAWRYIDIVKISSGTMALYTESHLRRKLEIYHEKGIHAEAGGSHFEVALWKGRTTEYFKKLVDFGVDVVEIADGHLPLPDSVRFDCIKEAKDLGLLVATEVGKKLPSENIKAPGMVQMIHDDLAAGADYVIIEGKASGMDVGIFDDKGNVNQGELNEIINGVSDLNKLIWEAPLRLQEQALILQLGPNVNLGNIFPQEVYPLELMRNGLMLMPLIRAYNEEHQTK